MYAGDGKSAAQETILVISASKAAQFALTHHRTGG